MVEQYTIHICTTSTPREYWSNGPHGFYNWHNTETPRYTCTQTNKYTWTWDTIVSFVIKAGKCRRASDLLVASC